MIKNIPLIIKFLLLIVLMCCLHDTHSKSTDEIEFSEQSSQRGIHFIHESGSSTHMYLPQTMGSGVAFIDFDNDGDQDIILANGKKWKSPKSTHSTQSLYENNGKGYFKDITKKTGLDISFFATGISIGDINNDGFEDIFMTALGQNHLFINHNGEKFNHSQQDLDCVENAWSTSSGFFDYDNDGDLDLLVLNYVKWSKQLNESVSTTIDGSNIAYPDIAYFGAEHNCLFENVNGIFRDVSQASGMIIKNPITNNYIGKSLSLNFLDINDDGWQDIVIANNADKNFIFINNKNKTFTEKGLDLGLAYDLNGSASHAFSITSAYDNNAKLIIAISNNANHPTAFYRQKNNIFNNETYQSGININGYQHQSFVNFFFDVNMDGQPTYFQANSHFQKSIVQIQNKQSHKQNSQLFMSCTPPCSHPFKEINEFGDLSQIKMAARSAAYADIDNDGDLDIVINQANDKALLFINQIFNRTWFGIQLTTNHLIQNAKITVYYDNVEKTYLYTAKKSYLSQMQSGLIIAKNAKKVNFVKINYQGKVNIIKNLNINQWNKIQLEDN